MTPETFCEQFATIAEAPNGVAKLRELIRQLAVQGKLGTHDVNDEPASVLIDAIVSQKADLVRDKKVRNSNSHTSRDAGHETHELPRSWSWVTLDTITEIGTGGTPPTGTKEYYQDGTIPWITSAATNSEFIAHPEHFITQRAVADCGLKIYPAGSLVVALYGQGKTRGQVGQLMFDSTSNQACALIRFFGDGLGIRDYVRLFFRKMYHELRDLAAGGAQPNLNGGMIRLMRVPLPPLAEQRRIVGKVDQLLGLCDELAARQAARREARSALVGATLDRLVSATDRTSRHRACPGGSTASALLDCAADSTSAKAVEPLGQAQGRRLQEDDAHRLRDHFDRLFDTPTTLPQLRQAILQLAVQGQLVPQDPNDEPATLQPHDAEVRKSGTIAGDNEPSEAWPFDIPPSWRWLRLRDTPVTLKYGTSVKCDYEGNGVPVLRIPNVVGGRIDLENLKYGELTDKEQSDLRLEKGDLLLIRSNGSTGIVGRTAVVDDKAVGFAYAGYLVRVRYPKATWFPDFLHLAMISPATRDQIEGPIRTTSGVKNINSTEIGRLMLPLPPLSEQKRIVSQVTELLSLCDALEAKLTQAESASTQLLSAAVHHLLTQCS